MKHAGQYGHQRGEAAALTMVSGFDQREQFTIAGSDTDLTTGSVSNADTTGDWTSRAKLVARSLFNEGSSSALVYYKVSQSTKFFHVNIPAGQYFHAYQTITHLGGSTTGSASGAIIDVCYVDKQIVQPIVGKVDE